MADGSGEVSKLSVRSDREGVTLTLSFAGELDAQTAPRFQSAIEEARRSDAGAIVLDLTDLQFADSSGLVGLLMAARRSERDGTRLRIRAGSGHVRQSLELTGIDEKLNLID